MKKILLAAALFLFLWIVFPPPASAGPTCTNLGGSCKTSCSSSEQDGGLSDCTRNPRGPSEKCCIPGQAVGPTAGCSDGESINTAIGCIPVGNTNAFIGFILRWAIGVGGGIAFLLILYAGFMIMTSSGNPDRLKAGQELMTSAIAGIIMLIFSVFVLRVIGVDILKLPGFGD
ncbi:hypothetical protein A2V61_01805 [Candidatus Woesebacteria bacterium RBG_19FT_COMBO_47_8]|uniref:Uncharacterized protein n=1 Tax=Candidatus Woesebacteria bacterium RBG_13_46_13 TaxID=1802479 RepID=A0A1F7X510_9BACT|nr:MAG: hypothetical protein A2Y68_01820 [Candidatus Woesebacteria bacterium RBG_13_46_13]OGM17116.1 MAG: hypothetical protein A2V61_01805 [Candidatus Woesebacteria bacterium RBG_19FT_COMBO_47_8]HJX59320.1 hypothetical protein [Patescibacteria group bacterium]